MNKKLYYRSIYLKNYFYIKIKEFVPQMLPIFVSGIYVGCGM